MRRSFLYTQGFDRVLLDKYSDKLQTKTPFYSGYLATHVSGIIRLHKQSYKLNTVARSLGRKVLQLNEDKNPSTSTRWVAKEQLMPVTANNTFRKLLVAPLLAPSVEKRRTRNQNMRSTERILKACPPVSRTATNLNVAEAIERAKAGDPAVFEYLYKLHSPRVYALCLRMVKDTTEAEDMTQEAFLLLFRKIHTFRGESAFSTWLHRLTVNAVLMRLRKKLPSVVSIEATADSDDENPLSSSIEFGAPDLTLEGAIDRINLERCIEQLPTGFRKVFVLHDIHGCKHREIAKLLGRTVGDSKSQLHKARKRLRESLRELQRDKTRDERIVAAKCSRSPFRRSLPGCRPLRSISEKLVS